MENKTKLKLTVAHAKCEVCGMERVLYFTSSFSYGERVVSSISGKQCAYTNLLDENLMAELEQICQEVFAEKGIEISHTKLSRVISNLYGITCDDLNAEKVDTISASKCPNCLGKMVEDDQFEETIEEVEAPLVTHNNWSILCIEDKKERIVSELIRQGYL